MKRLLRLPVSFHVLLFWTVILFSSFILYGKAVRAEEPQQAAVLRVAFPEVKGFSETGEDGDRHGIVVDYLNEIAKYTGWKYEYIETDGETLIDEFLEGQYDLMGGAYYQPGFEKYFAYPDYNTGYSKSVLLTRRDESSIKAYDWKSMEGKTIGVYENAYENIRRLQEFLEINGIHCNIKSYSKEQSVEGTLYTYLKNGEVDMLLGNNADSVKEFRVVAVFDSQPNYIVTTLGNQEVLDGLNMALEKIMDCDPNFAQELYSKNFPDSNVASIVLSKDEQNYIAEKKTVSVAVVRQWHPMFCMDLDQEIHNGLIPDTLIKVQEFTGLEFTYIYTDSYIEALRIVQQGKADMLGAFLGTAAEGSQMELALTKPYASLNDIIVRNKSVSFPADGLTGAVIEGRRLPKVIKTSDIRYFPTVTEALMAVNRGEVDFFYGLSTRIEQEIQKHHYTNVVPNTLINDRNDLCFAVVSPAKTELLTIMNKAINSLSNEEKIALVNQNMISEGVTSLSIVEMIYANPVMFVAISACVFLLLAVLVVVVAHFRVHAAEMEANLEKAQADSRAKGDFLSRMSHEIRTPMNAIVGLSDLTCMMEGVQENVRENLTKIRASSHYLLNLISDILDMSRIESGMMTIAAEPFLLTDIIDELQDMLAADAQRHSLKFVVERNVENAILIGDAIRLKQVLTNLVSNAFKFTPPGGKVLLSVEETACSEEKAAYCFRVCDNGMGISEEDQKRIFEAFEQVGSNYSKSQGTGLGLTISRTIIQLMGGELKLKSELHKGSEFYFSAVFPIGEQVELAEAEAGKKEYDFSHMHILLAEDNDLNAEIAKELLTMQGAAVRRAKNGKEAVEMFRTSGPAEYQVILMDIQMPEMDGLKACRTIRRMNHPAAVTIPIIAMTANSFKGDVDAAAEAGMNGFVTKPVDVNYLYQVLQKTVH